MGPVSSKSRTSSIGYTSPLSGIPSRRGPEQARVRPDQRAPQARLEPQVEQEQQARASRARLVPLGRRVLLEHLDRPEVTVLQGQKVLRVIPGRRARREAKEQQALLAQLEAEGVKVQRVRPGVRDLLAMGALQALPDPALQGPQGPQGPPQPSRVPLVPPDHPSPDQQALQGLRVPPEPGTPSEVSSGPSSTPESQE